MEVRYGGLWGTVCDDLWDYQDAQVVCHQLGFPFAVAAVSSSVFGPGEGPIWMDNVECNGTESHIGECQRPPIDTINCVHAEDAGVLCSSELPTGVHACWYSVCCAYASVCPQLQQLFSSWTTVACTHSVVSLQLALSVVTRTVGAEPTIFAL